jgi:hypothetical protein
MTKQVVRVALVGLAAVLATARAAEIGSEVGDWAPAFALPDTEGRKVASTDYLGRSLVIVFYRGSW